MGEIDPKYNCQLFCILERKPYPQVIGTNRHISCGGFDLNGVEWKDNTLSGESELLRKDPYALYLSEPIGYGFKKVVCKDADIINNQKNGFMRIIQLRSEKNLTARWMVKYD